MVLKLDLRNETTQTQIMAMDELLIVQQLSQAGYELGEVQPILTHAHYEHQDGTKTMHQILKHEYRCEVMVKKLAPKNAMMETQMQVMDEQLIDLRLKLAGFELVVTLLHPIHVHFAHLVGIKMTLPTQRHALVYEVMVLESELKYVMIRIQLVGMDVPTTVYHLKLDGFAKVVVQPLLIYEQPDHQDMQSIAH